MGEEEEEVRPFSQSLEFFLHDSRGHGVLRSVLNCL